MDNEERISAAERAAVEEQLRRSRNAVAEIALEGSRAYHDGYRVGIKDAFFFACSLVIVAITVFVCMEGKHE